MTATLQFWFEFASPYSYLAALRIEALSKHYRVALDWRPFLLGALFKKDLDSVQSPMMTSSKKAAYMWMDVARQNTSYGFPPFRVPDPFPQNGILPSRIACLLMDDDRLPAFVRAVYTAHFQAGESLADVSVFHTILEQLGFDAGTILEAVSSAKVKQKLRDLTEEADGLGVFGAPFFVTQSGQKFWGDDRLAMAFEQAVADV